MMETPDRDDQPANPLGDQPADDAEDEAQEQQTDVIDRFATIGRPDADEYGTRRVLCWTCAHGLARRQINKQKRRDGEEWRSDDGSDTHAFWNIICTRLKNSPSQFTASEIVACNRYQTRDDAVDVIEHESSGTTQEVQRYRRGLR